MEMEASILERLEDLRRWQIEQQEQLLRQQQKQRELLTSEQDRMYQALGLSVQEIALEDSTSKLVPISADEYRSAENDQPEDSSLVADKAAASDIAVENKQGTELRVPSLQLNANRYLNFRSSIEGFSPRSEILMDYDPSVVTISSDRSPEKRRSEFSMEGVEPLPLDKPPKKPVAIDDLPVPSPRKSFKTMLEEQLRDCENEPTIDSCQVVVKRPFLKKGEGLARYKPNPGGKSCEKRTRPRSASLSASMHFSSATAAKNSATKLKDTPKSSRTPRPATKNLASPSVAQSRLNLKNVPPPKKKIRSKSMSAVPKSKSSVNSVKQKPPVDANASSDFETKTRRELEEMRIFELLEEKAENSSFCSNSSTVLALFRQSTPMKLKNSQKNLRIPQKRLLNDSTRRESSDTSLEEIVRTTRTNLPASGSPVTKIRETVIQKDIVFSKWDSGPFQDENTDANLLTNNRGLHRVGSYKETQHTKQTTIQFNNNNNNNDFRKPVVHSDEEKDACDAGYCNKVDNINAKNNDKMPIDNEETNLSLHVRFAEYNEYKTIGLTDTSMISNDSNPPRNCIDDKAWSDRSTSPDSSEVEVLYSKNGVQTPRALDGLALSLQNTESRSCGNESDRTTDDEQYTSTCCSDENSYDGDDTISEINGPKVRVNPESDDESEVCNDSGSTIRQENDEVATSAKINDSVDAKGTIFKSELLKTRLSELEREIDIFRKENAALANQRAKLQEEQTRLQKEFKQKEEHLEKERRTAEESMQEEKKRLAREKAALENRLRDAREKSLQTKQERQKTQGLQEQLDALKEETTQKESRWQAAQARQKSQMRVLQAENAKLKQELENLRQLRNNKARTHRVAPPSNTRAIHRISKQLDDKKRTSPKRDSSSEEDSARARIVYDECEVEDLEADQVVRTGIVDADGSKMIVYNGAVQQCPKSNEDAQQKRILYTDLLNEATEGLRGRDVITLGKKSETFEAAMNRSQSNRFDDAEDEVEANQSVVPRSSENSYTRRYENSVESYKNAAISANNQETRNERLNQSSGGQILKTNRTSQEDSNRSSNLTLPRDERTNIARSQDIREVQCPDGHLEYWYPNGNVKKIFPDRNVTKMIFYNGDVREKTEDGSVKYFYASTKTWHTTMPDGLEILEFPDGQVERRMKNGTTEVSFPDGSVRLLQSDGTEKWVLPDGTVAETFPDGDKILSFPNGQREVHTKEHKRREYPDGTVKLLYPDGTQETRYSTGQVRVKDKDGNLLMDVHHR